MEKIPGKLVPLNLCPPFFNFFFMKSKLSFILFINFCLISCEENPDICLERKPIPVIYSLFNKYDSVNYLYITKTWSGDNGGSLVTARNPDSIYFKNVTVDMDLIRHPESGMPTSEDTVHVVPEFEWIHDKQPGYFSFPDCPVFALHYNLEDFDLLINHVNIPGYETIILQYNLLSKPVFYSPNRDGTAIAILPDKGLSVKFSARGLIEIRLFFEIIEKSVEGIFSDTIMVMNYSMASPVTFKYGNLTSALNLQLNDRSGIEYRQFGKIRMEIWSCEGNFPGLSQSKVSSAYIDFTLPGSPWVPGLFAFGGTIAENHLDNLELDEKTRDIIANDTSLSRFKFVKW